MSWNWQQDGWPDFTYDAGAFAQKEERFLYGAGVLFGGYEHLAADAQEQLTIELVSGEALTSSAIEEEYLDRDSVQSSLRAHLGLPTDNRRVKPAESGMAELMADIYLHYDDPLTHEALYRWHRMLTKGRQDLQDIGCYRTAEEAMEIVSGPWHAPIIHFQAPPSAKVFDEMEGFVQWYNASRTKLPAMVRAATAHLYFESIHPFEDGNGRIGRALSEKVLSQHIHQPTLIGLSHVIHQQKKQYYAAFESVNRSNDITVWLDYFLDVILAALENTQNTVEFVIKKAQLFERLKGVLNARQEKCLLRLFQEGAQGFEGGLSAKNYMRITQATVPTATRDLHDLVLKGALRKTGERKATRYFLNI